jgi:hypothetical protein
MSTEMENKLNNLEIGAENSVQNEIIGENLPIEAETVTENNVAQEILPEIGEDEIKEPVAEVMAEAKLVETTEDVFISANEIEEHEAILGEADAEESTEHSSTDFSGLNNDDIIEKLRFLIHETNVEESRKAIESLKNQFYKNLKNEQDRLKAEIKENTGDDIEVELPKDAREEYLKELMADYRKKKAELNQLLEAEKLNNLKLKEEIIEKIKGLANSENPLNKTFAEFKSLQQEWLTIGPVPNAEANNLWKSYQLQIERFYDLVKINNELRDLDFKRNLEQKVELCEKAEELLLMTDVVAAYKQLQEYHDLWKELGPVPTDKREEIWDRFSITSKKIRQNYQDHFEKLKEERNANYEQKVILCEKAESILNDVTPSNGKEWTDLSDQILELQKIWKTIGMVPSNVNNEIYERFRAACNKFFDAKKEFFGAINDELSTNLQKKIELCVHAESIKDSNEWKKTTEIFLDLQKKWKEIGAVPKKNSDQVWKRFRAACDHFFNAKSAFYSNIDSEQKENLKKKEDLIAEVKAFVPTDNQNDNISKVKEFQTRWTEIGFVASSQKDRLYAEFRGAVNDIFNKLNLNRNSLELSNFNSKVESMKDSGSANGLAKERSRVLQRIQELNSEILQIENNMGFFSSGSESIIRDFKKKIEKAQEEIKTLKEKKKSIDLAERELKKKEENNE